MDSSTRSCWRMLIVCQNNHSLPLVRSLAQGEFGVRGLTHGWDLGLSVDQMRRVAAASVEWKKRYIEYAEGILALGDEIDRELCQHSVDLQKVHELAAKRREQMARMESEYLEAWARVNKLFTAEQYDALFEVYRAEFKNLPHPIIGSDARERRSDLLEDRRPDLVAA